MFSNQTQRRGRLRGHVAFFSLMMTLLSGCATPPAVKSAESWTFEGHPGRIIQTQHYRIYTTITDVQTTAELSTLMESALLKYERFAPGSTLSKAPMPCYFFAERSEWTDYTRQHTGAFAPLYLKINRGGYTIDDTFVAYGGGNSGTFSVAAHEGFHQFIARNFKTRPPPFLEEGLASLFETVRWTGEEPRWDLSITPARAARLKRASEAHELWPLEALCTMHAGDVVNLSSRKIETFYAQDWAFAQFLARDPRYSVQFKQMMQALCDGSAARFSMLPPESAKDAWNPQSAKPLLEHYLGVDLSTVSHDYASFVHQIAINHFTRYELE